MTFNWKDLAGTVNGFFRIGVTGVRLKNLAGNLGIRNAGDTADANLTAAKVSISGNVLELNSDAAASGADFMYSLTRPANGMTDAVNLTLPADDGTAGQVLQTDGIGNLSWVAAGTNQLYVDKRIKALNCPLDFGTTSVRGWGEPIIQTYPWPTGADWKDRPSQLFVARVEAIAPNDFEEIEGQGITARFGKIVPMVSFELILSSAYSEGRGKFNVVIIGVDIFI